MSHPLFEGTRDFARRFREERRDRKSLSAEQFLDAQRESSAYPAGIAREQWVALLDVLRNAHENEVDDLVREWLAQLPKSLPDDAAATLPLDQDGEATLKSPQEVPAQDAQFIDRRYRIVRTLGEGAFGKVFLVKDKLQNDQELALKLIKKEHTATSEALVRFKNEILLLRVLNHPGIPQIFNDGISEDGEFYYTMAYVAGRTLDDVIRKEAPLEPLRIVRITKQVLDVLDYAHARGAIHRDLKPGNIFLLHAGTPKEQVRVLDFGIAKVLSREGILEHAQTMNTELPLGTPHYMSPEQVRGTEVDGRTDLYALGVIIYQMCSGRFPFTGKTLLEILSARLEKPPNPLEDATTPAWLRDVVMKLLEREREARPDTTAIRVMLDQLQGTQRALSRKLTWIGAAVVVIAVLLGWYVFKGAEKSERELANAPKNDSPPKNDGVSPALNDAAKTPAVGEQGEKSDLHNTAPKDEAGKQPVGPVEIGADENPSKIESGETANGKSAENPTPDEPTRPNPAPIAAFSLDQLDPPKDRTVKISASQKTLLIKGKASRALASVTVGTTEGTIDAKDRTRFEVNVALPPPRSAGVDEDSELTLDLVDELAHEHHKETLHVTRSAALLPRGCTASAQSTIDDQGRVTEIVHEKTGIVLALVEAAAGQPAFYLGVQEVTNREASAGAPALSWDKPLDLGLESHPAAGLSFEDAQLFCERHQLRLASAAEWDRAAQLAGHVYPWGDEFAADACNSKGETDKFLLTAPARSFVKDKCGPFFDMAGNVSEWCVDANGKPALRGGNFKSSSGACKLTSKGNPPSKGSESIGFRVALSQGP